MGGRGPDEGSLRGPAWPCRRVAPHVVPARCGWTAAPTRALPNLWRRLWLATLLLQGAVYGTSAGKKEKKDKKKKDKKKGADADSLFALLGDEGGADGQEEEEEEEGAPASTKGKKDKKKKKGGDVATAFAGEQATREPMAAPEARARPSLAAGGLLAWWACYGAAQLDRRCYISREQARSAGIEQQGGGGRAVLDTRQALQQAWPKLQLHAQPAAPSTAAPCLGPRTGARQHAEHASPFLARCSAVCPGRRGRG